MMFDMGALSALVQVVLINAVLSGDNAMVIGLAAMGLPPHQRTRAVWAGIALATVMLAGFAVVATSLLKVLGLLLAGGLLLLFVAWKLWRDISAKHAREDAGERSHPVSKTIWHALWQIVVADVSMSLDNVLAVAGAASEHPKVLVVGLGISIALMACAATLMARLLARYRWLVYVGLAVIVFVALRMIWSGAHDVAAAV